MRTKKFKILTRLLPIQASLRPLYIVRGRSVNGSDQNDKKCRFFPAWYQVENEQKTSPGECTRPARAAFSHPPKFAYGRSMGGYEHQWAAMACNEHSAMYENQRHSQRSRNQFITSTALLLPITPFASSNLFRISSFGFRISLTHHAPRCVLFKKPKQTNPSNSV